MREDPDFQRSSRFIWWYADLPVGSEPTILYYFFEITSGTDRTYYIAPDSRYPNDGTGRIIYNYDDQHSFQITVYDPGFRVPSWLQRGIIYQVFPDRFRDGNKRNDPLSGRFFYGVSGKSGAIVRSGQSRWNYPVGDPREPGSACTGHYNDNFYGGDLPGVIDKVREGYFDSLGVSILYLNPIFVSPSAHKYDTSDYFQIDPDFGTRNDFRDLVDAARQHRIRIILDGVFNHVSADSKYFDRYARFKSNGACGFLDSPYRSWFVFSEVAPGTGTCAGAAGPRSATYAAWGNFDSLPALNSNEGSVRKFFWSDGSNSVGPFWISQGASGWRLDAAADVDPGLVRNPGGNYWKGFRAAVRDPGIAGDTEPVLIGEEWRNASPWLLGTEWDSATNYRLRAALLGWLATGCSGSGCSNGLTFEDNDSNDRGSGAIRPLTPSQFHAQLMAIWQDYPPPAFKAMMNLGGSHDTNRMRFLLRKSNHDDDLLAKRRMKEWWLFALTYPGAPTIYYGDEVGLCQDGVFAGGKYEDDPYNRAPFPWDDTPGTFVPLKDLQNYLRTLVSIRLSYRALQDGNVVHGLIIDDDRKLYGFGRTWNRGSMHETALVALNRSDSAHVAVFRGLNARPYFLPNGTVLVDALNGGAHGVVNGCVRLSVKANWGTILLQPARIDQPARPQGLRRGDAGGKVVLRWSPVVVDALSERELAVRYEVYRGQTRNFPVSTRSKIAVVDPPAFGTRNGDLAYTDVKTAGHHFFYRIRAVTAPGRSSISPAI
jgi:glycosidase